MPKHHPVETKIRAFGLFMDYATAREASDILEIPQTTVQEWFANSDLTMDGVSLSWREFRGLTEAKRALISGERLMSRTNRFDFDKYQRDHAESAAADLQKARKAIMEAIDDDPTVKMSPAMLPKLVEAELLIQGKATKITEEKRSIAILIGRVVSHHVNQVIKDDGMREILMDRIEEDVDKIEAAYGDERALAKMLK